MSETSYAENNSETQQRTLDNNQIQPVLDVVEEKVDVETSKFVELLLEQKKFLCIAITGHLEIGKTTLARRAFDDHRIANAFSSCLWIRSLESFDSRRLLSEVKSVAEETIKLRNVERCAVSLSELLKGRRFLIVLDDVRSSQINSHLLETLNVGAFGSRLLITTRDESVARRMNAAYIYRIRTLTVEDGWLLLQKMASVDEKDPEIQKIRDVGLKIVQKCKCLPYSLRIIGGVLSTKKDRIVDEWNNINNSQGWSHNDFQSNIRWGRWTEEYLEWNSSPSKGAIRVGYDDLSRHVQNCFLCCSLFPPLSVIRRGFISRLWISEGFVEPKVDKTEEEMAQNHFEELLSRGLLQPVPGEPNTTECIMHLSVWFLARTTWNNKIRNADQNRIQSLSVAEDGLAISEKWINILISVWFFARTTWNNQIHNADQSSIQSLSVAEDGLAISEKWINILNVSVLKTFGNQISSYTLGLKIRKFKQLHILDLSATQLVSFPACLSSLVHLRYLNLSYTRIRTLPKYIGRLANLQFLGLRSCHSLHNLPKEIAELTSLLTLDLHDTILKAVPPIALSNLKNLTYLHGFLVGRVDTCESNNLSHGGWQLDDLCHMENLMSLQILISDRISSLCLPQADVLFRRTCLKELELSVVLEKETAGGATSIGKILKSQTVEGPPSPSGMEENQTIRGSSLIGMKILDKLNHLESLVSLKLVNVQGQEQRSWILGPSLPNLERLYLINCKISISLPALGQLSKLQIVVIEGSFFDAAGETEHPVEVTEKAVFPELQELYIKYAENMQYWPNFKGADLPNLQKFHIESCSGLSALPGGLEHATMLSELEIRNASTLKAVSNLPALRKLVLENCGELNKIENLPRLNVLQLSGCPMVQSVDEVDSLCHLRIEDATMEKLPEWLEKNASKLRSLNLVCSEELLERSLKEDEWLAIREAARVYADLPSGSSYFVYTRSNGKLDMEKDRDEPFQLMSLARSIGLQRRWLFSFIVVAVSAPMHAILYKQQSGILQHVMVLIFNMLVITFLFIFFITIFSYRRNVG